MTTNEMFNQCRDWRNSPGYFPRKAQRAEREYYSYCFRAQIPTGRNDAIARRAMWDARKPWLSTTARDRYYDEFHRERLLRRELADIDQEYAWRSFYSETEARLREVEG